MEPAPRLISAAASMGMLHPVNQRRSFHGRQFNDGHLQDPSGSAVRSKAHQTQERPFARRGLAQLMAGGPGGNESRKKRRSKEEGGCYPGRRSPKFGALSQMRKPCGGFKP